MAKASGKGEHQDTSEVLYMGEQAYTSDGRRESTRSYIKDDPITMLS
jgi:hypothetical protein